MRPTTPAFCCRGEAPHHAEGDFIRAGTNRLCAAAREAGDSGDPDDRRPISRPGEIGVNLKGARPGAGVGGLGRTCSPPTLRIFEVLARPELERGNLRSSTGLQKSCNMHPATPEFHRVLRDRQENQPGKRAPARQLRVRIPRDRARIRASGEHRRGFRQTESNR